MNIDKEYLEKAFEEYRRRRDFLLKAINEIPGVYSPMPMGAFYTVARLPVPDAEAFCRWCLEEFSYKGRTVFMAPAAGFYTLPGYGKDEVRMAYVLSPHPPPLINKDSIGYNDCTGCVAVTPEG